MQSRFPDEIWDGSSPTRRSTATSSVREIYREPDGADWEAVVDELIAVETFVLNLEAGSGAPLDSPEFEGVPTAPTATQGTSTTQIATTEFVASGLTEKADDTTVVHKADDETIDGTKTHTAVIIHDLAASSDARATRIIPPATAPPIDFFITGFAGGNVPGGSNGYQNGVISLGWNCGGGADKINPDWPTFRIGMECNYWTGSEYWMEGHLFAFTPHSSSGEIRPLSIGVNKSNNYDTFTIFQGSTWTWANVGQTKQRAQLYADVNNNVGFKVVGDDGLESLYITSFASPKTDTLTIGRTSSTQTNVTFASTGFTNLYLVAGAATASITTTTTILAIKAPAAGGFIQDRADNWQLLNYAASRFIIRAGDNGTATQIGFLGAAPVVRQSGDIATGLVNLGLFSTATLAVASGTSGRVVFETTGGVLTDSAGLTFNGTVLSATSLAVGGGTTVTKILSATGTLNFDSTLAQSSSDLTISLTGAVVGDSVALGIPASPDANTCFSAWVSAADTVTVRFMNCSAAPVDPASGTYRVTIIRF